MTSPNELIAKAQKVYLELFHVNEELKGKVSSIPTMSEMANNAYALKQAEDLLNDIRKEITKTKELYEKITCFIWYNKWGGRKTTQPIRTDMCTASVKGKVNASLPTLKRDSDQYHTLMDLLMIPREIQDKELVNISWPAFMEYLTNSAASGMPLPPGIDPEKTFYSHHLTYRKKNKE